MKRLLSFAILFIFFSYSSFAQKFLHYYLNDSSYQGFYIDLIDSIVNDTYNTIVYTRGQSLQIPLSNIDSIVVEACSIDEDTSIDYRIYEFNVNNDEYPFHKVIADNRASLFISKNGSFAGNDTVLIHSLYYGAEAFCCLDSLGRVRELYDTLNVVLFHYLEDSCLMIVFNKNDSTWQEYYVSIDSLDAPLLAKTINPAPFFKRIGKVGKELFRLRGNASTDLAGIIASIGGSEMMKNVELLRDAYDRPDNWGGRIFVDALGITKDVIGILASIAAEPFSGGISTATLLASCGSLMYDVEGLVNDIFPDEERKQRYKDYYRNHYGISLTLLPAINSGPCDVELRASLYSSSKKLGNVDFHIIQTDPFNIDNSYVYRSDVIDTIQLGQYILGRIVNGLSPNTEYGCSILDYSIVLNGITLTYFSDDFILSNESSFSTGDVFAITTLDATYYQNQVVFNYETECACIECEYGIEFSYAVNDSIYVRRLNHNPDTSGINHVSYNNPPYGRTVRYRAFYTLYEDSIFGEYDSIYIPGAAFSISPNQQAVFSQGNLQYQASTNTWRFAEHQYDFIGNNPGNMTMAPQCIANFNETTIVNELYDTCNCHYCVNYMTGHTARVASHYLDDPEDLLNYHCIFDSIIYNHNVICPACSDSIRSINSDWIDLFHYGSSGYNGRLPYLHYLENIGGNINNTNYDWGQYCQIINGGTSLGWRTPTAEEWNYVCSREGLWGFATINGISGLVLLPDTWQTPEGIVFLPDTGSVSVWYKQNQYPNWYYINNNYTTIQWSEMEIHGAVFLPGAGLIYASNYTYTDGGYTPNCRVYSNTDQWSYISTVENYGAYFSSTHDSGFPWGVFEFNAWNNGYLPDSSWIRRYHGYMWNGAGSTIVRPYHTQGVSRQHSVRLIKNL